ncbi:DUF6082 family protein [Streptomyces sp. NPDC088745]|uniref:DUF6082 family protein n=1 Tax=Streptomyces sp. NPDC088745 TaxID=3365884 RepID=UPI0037F3C822
MHRPHTTHILLTALVVVGATHTALSARDRMRARVQTYAGHHLALLRDFPGYGSKLLEGKSEEERTTLVACNAWVSFWSHHYKAGLISRDHLRELVSRFLDGPSGLGYWEWARASWAQAPKNHYSHVVEGIFDDVLDERGLGAVA